MILACALGMSPMSNLAQNDCDGERYRYTSAFPDVNVMYDVPYGANVNALGLWRRRLWRTFICLKTMRR